MADSERFNVLICDGGMGLDVPLCESYWRDEVYRAGGTPDEATTSIEIRELPHLDIHDPESSPGWLVSGYAFRGKGVKP